MALIKCDECGKEISSKADSCPNCGNPINGAQKNLVQMDTAPKKRRKYRVRLLFFIPMWFFGSIIFMINMFSGNEGIMALAFYVALIGLIGTIVSSIGLWLSKP